MAIDWQFKSYQRGKAVPRYHLILCVLDYTFQPPQLQIIGCSNYGHRIICRFVTFVSGFAQLSGWILSE
jgi:hypothetical protein